MNWDNDTANITVYSPIQLGDVTIKLAYDGNTVFEEKANISPTDIFTKSIPIPNIDETKLTLAVYKDGNKLLSYTPMGENDEKHIIRQEALPEPQFVEINRKTVPCGYTFRAIPSCYISLKVITLRD